MKGIVILLVAVVLVVRGEEAAKRDSTDALSDAEQAAGKAVLKLLDAKIGRKVQDAAKEVTDFLTSAIGKHATSRSDKIQQDKEKELSLLHLGAVKVIQKDVHKAHAQHKDKPMLKKKKDGSFLVHFKIPYMVTPIKKKHHHHHHKKHHHYHKHHYYHKKHRGAHDKPPPVEVYHSAPRQPGTQAPSPYPHTTGHTTGYRTNGYSTGAYNTGTFSTGGYGNTGYTTGMTTGATMAPVSTATTAAAAGGQFSPCQGMCNAPCTPQCTPATDCCCCPSAQAATAHPAMPPPPPPYNPNQPPLTPSQFMQLPLLPGSPCPQICKRHCISRCPSECCDDDKKKRTNVEKPKKTEDKPQKAKQEAVPAEKKTDDKPVKTPVENKTEAVQDADEEDQTTTEDQREEGSTNESTDDDVE